MNRTPEPSRARFALPQAAVAMGCTERDLVTLDGVPCVIVERWNAGGYTACRAVPVDKLNLYSPKRPWIPVENPRYAAWAKAEADRARRAAAHQAAIERSERPRTQTNFAASAAQPGEG